MLHKNRRDTQTLQIRSITERFRTASDKIGVVNLKCKDLVTSLNKANTSDKETSFLDLNITGIGSDIYTSVYAKGDDFGFPIVNFPWLSGDVPRLPSYGIYISQLVRFARCCTSVLDFQSKIHQLLQNCGHRVIDITSFEKHLESSLDQTPNFCRNFVIFPSKNMCLKESLTQSSMVI